MKVAVVLQQLAPELEGGAERVALAQARRLREQGHGVWLVCGTQATGGESPATCERHGFRVLRVPRAAGERWEVAVRWPRAERLAAAACAGADAVHLHHAATFGAGIVRALAAVAPVTVTLHDAFAACPRAFRSPSRPDVACPPGGERAPCVRCLAPDLPELDSADIGRRLRERAEAFAADLAAAAELRAPSAWHARRMEALLGLPAGRIRVEPPPPTRALRRVHPPGSTLWRPGTPLRVLHFGNLSRAKGTLDLALALAPLAPAVELDLLGRVLDPHLAAALEGARGRLQLRRLGAYGSAKLEDAARAAHLAAFPSRLDETYALVADEALALGLPVWTSDRGAPAARLADRPGCRVLPAEDPCAWTAAFRRLLADPLSLTGRPAA